MRVVDKLGVLGLAFGVQLTECVQPFGVGEVTFLVGYFVSPVVPLFSPRRRDALSQVDFLGVSLDP